MTMRLVSLNVEYSKHLSRTLPFLRAQDADVVCIQEMKEKDIALFREATSSIESVFVPMTSQLHGGERVVIGIALLSRFPITQKSVKYYAGNGDTLPECDTSDPSTYKNKNSPVIVCDVEKGGATLRIATTHFTWTPDGSADDLQRAHIERLLQILDESGEFVLVGDLNAPRGGEIFSRLAARYTDNIPPEYKTSIDVGLHRAGKLRPHELADKMVDGCFSTSAYTVSDVALVDGVSDHMAIVGDVRRTEG